MTTSIETLAQFKKAAKLVRLSQRYNGARSYKRGQGLLLKTLAAAGGTADRAAIIEATGWSRHNLKNIFKKAERNGFVTLIEADGQAGYAIELTAEGKEVIAKREEANVKAADKLLADFTAEEIAQLNALTEKLIVAAKSDEAVTAYGKGLKLHKGHRGHRPYAARKAGTCR